MLCIYPEAYLSGYQVPFGKNFLSSLDPVKIENGLEKIEELCKSRKAWVIVGTLFFDTAWKNSVFLYGRPNGRSFRYDKVNLATHER